MSQQAENGQKPGPQPDSMFGPVVFSYTRAQAIADGVLVDVTSTAREAGFRFPMAVTEAVWKDCVEWTEEDSRSQVPQDQSGRLWDVLFMAYLAVRTNPKVEGTVHYGIVRVPRDGTSQRARRVELKLVLSGGDQGEPVLTVMQPHED